MSSALAWLRQQRGERPRPAVEKLPTAATINEPLALLHRLRSRNAAPIATGTLSLDRDLPGHEVAPGLWRFEQHRAWPVLPSRVDAHWAGLLDIERHQLCFFDSETTGLAGGTGTRAFMLGLARATADGLHLTQFTTTTLAAEPRLLEAFLGALPDDAVLVSYNGKSYDRPLLSTRLRLNRMADPLPDLPHLDLLHPTRRQLKDVLPNCRLGTVERHWLDIVREDDLPGSEAPTAWLSFLRGGSARLLRRVGEHNAQDLVSLATLFSRLGTVLATPGSEPAKPPVR